MTDDELRALLAAATPGPWPMKPTGDYKRILVGIGLVDGPHGYDVAEVYSDDCDRKEADANARLIAAAPDLAAEVLRLRAKEAAGERLAEAVRPIAEAAGTWMPYEETDETAGARLEHPKYGLERHAAFTFGDLFRTASALTAWEAAK